MGSEELLLKIQPQGSRAGQAGRDSEEHCRVWPRGEGGEAEKSCERDQRATNCGGAPKCVGRENLGGNFHAFLGCR